MDPIQRGALIVFEGIDRCGKSTQSTKLVEHLNKSGHSAVLFRFPNRKTRIGQIIDDYLTGVCTIDDRAVHLLFSADRWQAEEEVVRLLKSGTTVVMDRYAYSGAVFTATKGIDIKWCKSTDKGLPAPDLVIYLNLSVSKALTRGGFGKERYEKQGIQEAAKAHFESDEMIDPSWILLDADCSVDEIQNQVRQLALAMIEASKNKPIKMLWSE